MNAAQSQNRHPPTVQSSCERWHVPASPLPMWIFDPETGAILAANDAAVLAYGYTRDELLRCSVDEICRPTDPGRGLSASPLARTPAWTGTFEQRRRDGSTFEADIAMVQTGTGQRAAMVIVDPQPRRDDVVRRQGTG